VVSGKFATKGARFSQRAKTSATRLPEDFYSESPDLLVAIQLAGNSSVIPVYFSHV
jgi:hypothetical protein